MGAACKQRSLELEALEQLALACWRGEVPFDDFIRRTDHEWRRHASQILRRWKAPTGVDDVMQEMRLRLWQKFKTYDPSRGRIWRFLVWGARVKGRTWVHAERGACKHGTRDKNPSRYARPFSSFVREGEDRQFDVVVEATQERCAAVSQAIARCRNSQDRRILRALVREGGDPERAAMMLFGEMDQRIARRLVVETVTSVGCELADFRAA